VAPPALIVALEAPTASFEFVHAVPEVMGSKLGGVGSVVALPDEAVGIFLETHCLPFPLCSRSAFNNASLYGLGGLGFGREYIASANPGFLPEEEGVEGSEEGRFGQIWPAAVFSSGTRTASNWKPLGWVGAEWPAFLASVHLVDQGPSAQTLGALEGGF
jgi:hypothetical protein